MILCLYHVTPLFSFSLDLDSSCLIHLLPVSFTAAFAVLSSSDNLNGLVTVRVRTDFYKTGYFLYDHLVIQLGLPRRTCVYQWSRGYHPRW
ncbi:MAG: hypothetical protein ACFFD4_27785 [Candidatus Odinarchaeota archaeon]